MQQGDAFHYNQVAVGWHLHIVLSHPDRADGQAVVVNITTWRTSTADNSCILDVGDHPAITHKSAVKYGGARIVSIEHFKRFGRRDDPLTPSVLARIIEGAAESPFIPGDCKQMLIDQAVIVA